MSGDKKHESIRVRYGLERFKIGMRNRAMNKTDQTRLCRDLVHAANFNGVRLPQAIDIVNANVVTLI